MSKLDATLEYVDRLWGDLTMLARARFATDTCRTMVAGVTVIVDKLESRFSLSREKLTCSSLSPEAVSTEVAGDAVAPGVLGGKSGLSKGLGDGDPESGVRTIPMTSCQRGLSDADDGGTPGRLGDGGGDSRLLEKDIGSGARLTLFEGVSREDAVDDPASYKRDAKEGPG